MGTRARVKLMVEDQCVRQLFMAMDGYPSYAGRQILAAVVPLTTLPLTDLLAVLERLTQDGPFENPPPGFDTWPACDYTYEFILQPGGMQCYVQHYDKPKTLVYEEVFSRQGDELWKRVIHYDWKVFF